MPDDEMSLSDAHSSRSENEDPDWSPPANGDDDDKGGDSSSGREEEEDNMEPDVGNLDEQAKPPAVGGSPCHNRRRISNNNNDRQHGGDRESGVRTTGAVVGGVFLFKFRLPTYRGGEFQLGIGISKVLHHGQDGLVEVQWCPPKGTYI